MAEATNTTAGAAQDAGKDTTAPTVAADTKTNAAVGAGANKPTASPPAAASAPLRWFECSLPGSLAVTKAVEAENAEQALALYFAEFGIVASETPATVIEIESPEQAAKEATGDGDASGKS